MKMCLVLYVYSLLAEWGMQLVVGKQYLIFRSITLRLRWHANKRKGLHAPRRRATPFGSVSVFDCVRLNVIWAGLSACNFVLHHHIHITLLIIYEWGIEKSGEKWVIKLCAYCVYAGAEARVRWRIFIFLLWPLILFIIDNE